MTMTTTVGDSDHRIRTDPAGNDVFLGAFLQIPVYFRPEKAPEDGSSIPPENFAVRGNEIIRQVPFTRFYPEVRRIRAENQSEINVSLLNLAGKVRIAAGCQLKNAGFRGTLIKSFGIFWVTEKQNKKSFKDLSETFLILRYFRQ